MEKIAIVTGASRGIGRAVALKLASQGMYVIVNYYKSEEKAQETVQLIREAGGEAELYQCNVADYEETGRMVAAILERYQHVDVLVNNAGITRDQFIERISEEDYDIVLNTNLKSCYNTMHHLSKQFKKQRKGRVINIASVSGVLGNITQANYSAAKAGMIGMTKTMAKEWVMRGITVNAIAPGFIETDMTDVLSDKIKEIVTAQIPMKYFGKPEDVASAAAFLASEEASYITGQVLCVDGGMAI